MTSIGRGRGWGKNPQDNGRRPGKQLDPVQNVNDNDNENDENDDWIERINTLDINDVAGIKSPQSPVANLITVNTSPDDMQHLEKACKKAIKDRVFAMKLVLAFSNSSNVTAPFLGCLQPYYEDRMEMLKKNRQHFLNLVFILGEAYHRIRYGNAVPPKVLELPLIVCLKMLLEIAGEEEIELAATEISMNGRMLQLRAVSGLSELFIYAREVLVTRNISSRSRALLLLITDLTNQNFMPLSGDLQKFYAQQLGQQLLLEMQENLKGLRIITDFRNKIDNDNDNKQKNDDLHGILIQVPGNQLQQPQQLQPLPSQNQRQEINSRNYKPRDNNSGGPGAGLLLNSVPRAIRGSGAATDSRLS
ncbi:uncharacterized protein LOC130665244 isoform X1 [Microplitis mediator]|uniref:uncharacterized protein LOC130665244 isoform X1 n=1 Tax=Microplitis mediator TaxID=375433 RepID=UPI002557116B|nr:uncharacterized protein LOC130665244 isoform X1 [Microplitis mediator]XP_057321552.1 uncharacterized protein LOC130665244 isoform X1 [Microplitis mediator]